MGKILEIRNLSAGALDGVNLDVADGARHLLRGANGSGKTTLAQAIIGNPDYPVKSGGIIFDGADITGMPTAKRARIGIFLGGQNVPEIPGLSVMTFLRHSFAAMNGDAPMGVFLEKLKAASVRLGIPDSWLGRSVNVGFSGGERKRLMFLHLILSAPKLAILDEPDSGADKSAQETFGRIISEMKSTSFLIISHLDVFFTPTAVSTLQSGKIVIE
jgi:Fe-S cluster assembly ATP-binding protein